MEKLQEDSVKIVQDNYKRYKKMQEDSALSRKIRQKKEAEIKENKKKIFKIALIAFLSGSVTALSFTALKKFNKDDKYGYYFTRGLQIVSANTHSNYKSFEPYYYNNDKIAQAIENNEEICYEEKREDDTKYLIAGISLNMVEREKNMNEVIRFLDSDQYKSMDEYVNYLGYNSYEEYIDGIKDELAVKKSAGRGAK